MTDVKIFISYKDRHKILKSDIITPIQTGRAISEKIFEDMIGDDTGDNISAENDIYSELTAQYWMWKHYKEIGDPDYIGLMQYRRHLILNTNAITENTPELHTEGYSVKFINSINDNYIKNIGLDDKTIKETIRLYDIITVKKSNLKVLNVNNPKEDYLKNIPGARENDYDNLIKTIINKYPTYQKAVEKFHTGYYRHFYHMYIMKKELFDEYNEFIFSILGELKNQIDYSLRGNRGGRVLGYLGEMLYCIYIFQKQIENYKIGEFYSTLVLNNNPLSRIKFEAKQNTAFIYFVNNNNVYKSVASIITLDKYLDSNQTADVICLSENLDANSKFYLKSLNLKHLNIILYEISNLRNNQQQHNNICLLLDNINEFIVYDNIYYINSRVIFNNQFNFSEFNSAAIAAAIDPQIGYKINHQSSTRNLIKNIIKLENIYNYVTDDLIILNPKKLEYKWLQKKLKTLPCELKTSSDFINYIFKDKIKIIAPPPAIYLIYLHLSALNIFLMKILYKHLKKLFVYILKMITITLSIYIKPHFIQNTLKKNFKILNQT